MYPEYIKNYNKSVRTGIQRIRKKTQTSISQRNSTSSQKHKKMNDAHNNISHLPSLQNFKILSYSVLMGGTRIHALLVVYISIITLENILTLPIIVEDMCNSTPRHVLKKTLPYMHQNTCITIFIV